MSEQGRNCLEVLGITSNIADQQQQQQAQIVSTYASAESSPNHSLSQTSQDMNKTLDSSSNSFTSQTSEHEKQNKLMQDLLNAINDQANKSPTLLQSEANKTVKSFIEKTIKDQLLIEPLNGPSNNSNVAPTTSPSSAAQTTRSHSTSSVFSLFQNIFSKSSSSSDKSKQQNQTSNSPASSTSSPNPETSPFKLLVNEMANKSDEEKLRQSMSAHNILSHSKSSDLAAKPVDDRENLEKLASLTKKEHEKCDPILSTSINSAEKASKQHESQKETLVPSSSKEFCMNLNLKLASSVAQTAIAPVAILENHLEHSRFTSNASTSSIHNDLKIILEESKNSNSSNSSASLNSEQRRESPKPQRPARHTSTTHSSTKTVSVEEKPKLEKELVQFGPQDGHYRYEKDFLMNIKEKKSGLIDNIYPEIFKAYCYCTTGKYWDPEKYFDIVQYTGEHDRAQKVEQNKQRNLIQNKQKRYAAQQQQQQSHQGYQQQRGPKNNYRQHQHDKKQRTNVSLENSEARKSSTNADKILLGLIKKSSDKEIKSEDNLLNMLQKPHQEPNDNKVLQELLFSNKEVKMKTALTAHELEMAQLNDGLNKKTELPMPSPKVDISTSASEVDLKNYSDAYQQLIKNLSNHPLSASPLINTHAMPTCHLIENGKENEQRTNLIPNETANILKQMLKLSSNPKSEHLDMNNKQHKSHNNNRHHKHPHHHKYEHKYQKQQQKQQHDVVILTQQSNSPLESLMSKLKIDSQQTQKEQQSQHFNSLLNKIMTPIATKPHLEEEKSKSDDILKWFNNPNKNSYKTVSDIERQLIMN